MRYECCEKPWRGEATPQEQRALIEFEEERERFEMLKAKASLAAHRARNRARYQRKKASDA